MIYSYPIIGRFGLGHGLLAWARSIVWARSNGATPIAPNWVQPRLGPILRNERDKRLYFLLFGRGNQIGGLRRLQLLANAPRVSAQGEISTIAGLPDDFPLPDFLPTDGGIMLFANSPSRNEDKFFYQISGHSELIRAELMAMTRARYRPAMVVKPHVALHVRGGDFGIAQSAEQLRSGRHNLRLPNQWYAQMLAGLRNALGEQVEAIIYSDCPDSELADLLAQPNVRRAPRQQSVTDLLAMGQAGILISSGSGFSRWGSFLGQVPRICFPGQRGVRVLGAPPIDGADDWEPEYETPLDISAAFLKLAAQRLGINHE